jgi:hypothetical protein
MLRDQADGAPIPQPPGPSTVLGKPHARYPGVAHGVRLRHAAHLQVPAGDVPAQIRRDGTSRPSLLILALGLGRGGGA